MLIENPLNMLVEIQRHSLDSPLYTIRLYTPITEIFNAPLRSMTNSNKR
jgi:hypothetical protein